MIWNGVKAASNQAKERIDRKLLASFGSNNRHGNPRHVDIKSSLGGGHCRIDLYEKATERSGWLLGCVTLRELLATCPALRGWPAVGTRLEIDHQTMISTQGESSLHLMETHGNIQRRLYDSQF